MTRVTVKYSIINESAYRASGAFAQRELAVGNISRGLHGLCGLGRPAKAYCSQSG